MTKNINVEYLLFDMLRREAIGRLFSEGSGGSFTTQQYADSYSRVTSKKANRRGNDRFPAIPMDQAEGHLNDCNYVISLGSDEWITTDSREVTGVRTG